jgi:hypothetical protein
VDVIFKAIVGHLETRQNLSAMARKDNNSGVRGTCWQVGKFSETAHFALFKAGIYFPHGLMNSKEQNNEPDRTECEYRFPIFSANGQFSSEKV